MAFLCFVDSVSRKMSEDAIDGRSKRGNLYFSRACLYIKNINLRVQVSELVAPRLPEYVPLEHAGNKTVCRH